MERVTTQRKYLNFSLFLAELLQRTHEQIAFVFARMEEAIETELRMSRIQHAGEADAVPRAVPMCAGLEHQHVQFYHLRMSWFLDPYQAIDQGWLLIMKSSTAQKLQWVNPPPMRVWAELNQPPKDFRSEQISRWSKPGPSSKLLQPGHVTLDQSKALTRQTAPSKIMVFSCPYFGARAGPLESSVTPAAWPHSCCSPPPPHFYICCRSKYTALLLQG